MPDARAESAVGSSVMSATNSTTSRTSPLEQIAPGIKITAQISPEPRSEDVMFVRQMGIEHVVLWTDSAKSSAEYYANRKRYFAENGLSVYGFGNGDVHNQPAIVLGLANRDAKIDEYKEIVDKGLKPGDAKYEILMSKASKRFCKAVKKTAKDGGYDLVARISCVKGCGTVPDITSDVVSNL